MAKSTRANSKWDSTFNLTDRVWRLFVSVRLTITLVTLLTLFSIAGTLIAQQGTTQVPIEKLYSPNVLKWLVGFGLTDIYHSAFFVFLLLMLAFNLITCSIERLPKVWKEAFRVAPPPLSRDEISTWSLEEAKKRKYVFERLDEAKFSSVREARAASMLFLQKHFGHYSILKDDEQEFQLVVEKGKFSRLGVYITHLSLLLIMFGAGTGAMIGYEGAMSIEEGTRQSWMQHVKGSRGGMTLMRENGVPVPNFLNLGFEVECERFTLETYDGERPKAFRSRLNFYENDVKVHEAEISVNHPTVYKGMTFYQASYAEAGIGSAAIKVFRVAQKQAKLQQREPSQEKPQSKNAVAVTGGIPKLPGASQEGKAPSLNPKGLPQIESLELVDNVRPGDLYRVDGDAAFKVVQMEPNLMDLGPAVKLQYFSSRAVRKPTEFWVFKSLPGFDFAHRSGSRLHFVLQDLHPKYATGLSVARDPGVWIVWIGSAILILALFIALYTCQSRYWIAFSQRGGLTAVGWSNKLFLFEPRFEKFKTALAKELKRL